MSYPFKEANESLIIQVWRKGLIISGYDENVWRYDICGKLIRFSDHGNTDSEYGWEIDHIYPESKGGSDDISNLQLLQWENNRNKADTYPWSC
ncbi:HNH endonuclease [bacterium]|nr:HNH endonuclease [bacterium]MBU1066067.1 HNH endonuclease [bacterium]MBU1632944.1 HNH endonuclease [bacterium]MBU1874339.1 HNH endonuclease [bacterium]